MKIVGCLVAVSCLLAAPVSIASAETLAVGALKGITSLTFDEEVIATQNYDGNPVCGALDPESGNWDPQIKSSNSKQSISSDGPYSFDISDVGPGLCGWTGQSGFIYATTNQQMGNISFDLPTSDTTYDCQIGASKDGSGLSYICGQTPLGTTSSPLRINIHYNGWIINPTTSSQIVKTIDLGSFGSIQIFQNENGGLGGNSPVLFNLSQPAGSTMGPFPLTNVDNSYFDSDCSNSNPNYLNIQSMDNFSSSATQYRIFWTMSGLDDCRRAHLQQLWTTAPWAKPIQFDPSCTSATFTNVLVIEEMQPPQKITAGTAYCN